MADRSYPKGMQRILAGSIDFANDDIAVGLVSNSYTYDVTHEFVSDLGALVGTAVTLDSVAIAGGVLDADEADFGNIAPGSTIKAAAIFKDTGNPSNSPLLAYIDSPLGLPLATNGGDVVVPWDPGAKRIFRLGLPFFPKGAEKTLAGAIDWGSDDLKIALMPSSYTYNAAHEFLDDVSAAIGSPKALSGVSIVGGVFDADDVDTDALTAGSTIGSAVIYKDTTDPSTSPLLLHVSPVTGFPFVTNGGKLKIEWSNGAAKIFSLVV